VMIQRNVACKHTSQCSLYDDHLLSESMIISYIEDKRKKKKDSRCQSI